MSHFLVLVTGKNPERQLAPFQENNMGTCPMKYMSFLDQEDEFLKEYESEGTNKVIMPDGSYKSPWDEEFRIVKDGFNIGSGPSHKVPDHLEQRDIPFKELYPTFEAFCAEWHGHKSRDEKKNRYGYWENPNAKWDWYVLGGRWTGVFKVKQVNLLGTNDHSYEAFMGFTAAEMQGFVEMYKSNPHKFAKVVQRYKGKVDVLTEKVVELSKEADPVTPKHAVGRPGLGTAPAKTGYADQLLKKDIDIEGMRREAKEKAEQQYDKAMSIIGGFPQNRTWDCILQDEAIFLHQNKEATQREQRDLSRDLYWAQPRCQAWQNAERAARKEGKKWPFGWNTTPDDFLISKEEYIKIAENNALCTFAVLHEGKWYEKGKMGWFGIVIDGKEDEQWAEEFSKLIDGLPDDTLISAYDCHI